MDKSGYSLSDYGQIGLFLAMVSKIDGLSWFLRPIMLVVLVVVRAYIPRPFLFSSFLLTLLSALFYLCQVNFLWIDGVFLAFVCRIKFWGMILGSIFGSSICRATIWFITFGVVCASTTSYGFLWVSSSRSFQIWNYYHIVSEFLHDIVHIGCLFQHLVFILL